MNNMMNNANTMNTQAAEKKANRKKFAIGLIKSFAFGAALGTAGALIYRKGITAGCKAMLPKLQEFATAGAGVGLSAGYAYALNERGEFEPGEIEEFFEDIGEKFAESGVLDRPLTADEIEQISNIIKG